MPPAAHFPNTWITSRATGILLRRAPSMDRVKNGVQDEEESDDEVEVVHPDKMSETRDSAPPPYHTACDQLNLVEEYVERCETEDAYPWVHEAKMILIEA